MRFAANGQREHKAAVWRTALCAHNLEVREKKPFMSENINGGRSFCGWLDVASGNQVVSEDTAHKKSATYVKKHK